MGNFGIFALVTKGPGSKTILVLGARKHFSSAIFASGNRGPHTGNIVILGAGEPCLRTFFSLDNRGQGPIDFFTLVASAHSPVTKPWPLDDLSLTLFYQGELEVLVLKLSSPLVLEGLVSELSSPWMPEGIVVAFLSLLEDIVPEP